MPMRSWSYRLAVVSIAALTIAYGARAGAEGDAPAGTVVYEPGPGLFAAAELGLAGRPLYVKLFPSGWPTTKDMRHLTLECGEADFADTLGAFLGSGLGLTLETSTLAHD